MTAAHDIHPATAADAHEIAAVHVRAWREAYAGILPAAMLDGLSVEERTSSWLRRLDDTAGHAILVARDRDRIVGFGSTGRQRSGSLVANGFAGEISALYLLQSHQQIGLGRRLMHALAINLLEQGFRTAALWVLKENERARGFYRRLGGVEVGERQETRPQAVLDEVAYGWKDLQAVRA